MSLVTLEIPEASPSANEHKWKHWSAHLKLRKHWSMLVMVAKVQACVPMQAPPDMASVRVTRVGKRLLDYDNGVAGLKSLLDSLREQRLIVDDSAEHMSLQFDQRKVIRGEYPRTIVEIHKK